MTKRDIKLIMGLGNPGEKHLISRSNIGFKILDVIASNNNIEIRTKKKKSLIGMGHFEGKEVILLKPQTFSELSGEAALYIASFLRIHPQDIIVILEDFHLSLGRLAITQSQIEKEYRHPAIPNLELALKSNEFVQVYVGIRGENVENKSREQYINEEFDPMENMQLINVINDTETAIRSIVHGEIKEVIEKYSI